MAGTRLFDRGDFSQRQSVNRRAHFLKSPLELGWRKIGPSRTGIRVDHCEAKVICGNAADFLEVIELVGRDSQNAIVRKRAMD